MRPVDLGDGIALYQVNRDIYGKPVAIVEIPLVEPMLLRATDPTALLSLASAIENAAHRLATLVAWDAPEQVAS